MRTSSQRIDDYRYEHKLLSGNAHEMKKFILMDNPQFAAENERRIRDMREKYDLAEELVAKCPGKPYWSKSILDTPCEVVDALLEGHVSKTGDIS